MNKQIAANRIIRANRQRNNALLPLVFMVCLFATLTVITVGISGLTA